VIPLHGYVAVVRTLLDRIRFAVIGFPVAANGQAPSGAAGPSARIGTMLPGRKLTPAIPPS
jgi:hypothetical protein